MAKSGDKLFSAHRATGGDAWNYRGPLSDDVVDALAPPASRSKIKYDSVLKGFGARVTAAAARSFVLNYRVAGTERRITIGSYPDWPTAKARDYAAGLKRRIDQGEDPMAERHAERAAPTVDDLADRFEVEHISRKRTSTQRAYRVLLRVHIRPALGKKKVAELRHADIEALHRKISNRAPYAANRTVAVLSRMLSLAVRWEMRADNPVRGLERAPEERRERYLSPTELARLLEAQADHPERVSANVVRLLLLTGARKGETLAAKWTDFDLSAGVWIKPAATTKTAKLHRVPLSAPALALLAEMRAEADKEDAWRQRRGLPPVPFLFPADRGDAPLTDIKNFWRTICIKAGLAQEVEQRGPDGKSITVWQPTARIHDLRHSYASYLASSGMSLPIIGALLGHTQPGTTARYAHLLDDPLRQATERAGAFIAAAEGKGGQEAEVIQHPGSQSTGRLGPARRARR